MMARCVRCALALTGALALCAPAVADDRIEISVSVPERGKSSFTVSTAQFRWGLNAEAGSGAYSGDCNFMSAGEVSNTGNGRQPPLIVNAVGPRPAVTTLPLAPAPLPERAPADSALPWSIASLLTLSAGTVVGFRRGLLVWPFRTDPSEISREE